MIQRQRLCAVCTALVSTLVSTFAVTSATAADLSTLVVVPPSVQPFYVVNQGPVISGPGIMIVAIGYTRTGLRQPYPFIGRAVYPAARIWPPPHHFAGKPWRRKPVRARY